MKFRLHSVQDCNVSLCLIAASNCILWSRTFRGRFITQNIYKHPLEKYRHNLLIIFYSLLSISLTFHYIEPAQIHLMVKNKQFYKALENFYKWPCDRVA